MALKSSEMSILIQHIRSFRWEIQKLNLLESMSGKEKMALSWREERKHWGFFLMICNLEKMWGGKGQSSGIHFWLTKNVILMKQNRYMDIQILILRYSTYRISNKRKTGTYFDCLFRQTSIQKIYNVVEEVEK